MVTIKMDAEDFAQLCADRIYDYWTSDSDVSDLFYDYYLNAYDGATVTGSIAEIVDNDYVNNFNVVSQADIDNGSAEREYGDIEDRIVWQYDDLYLISGRI